MPNLSILGFYSMRLLLTKASRRNTILFSLSALASSYIAVRYRRLSLERRQNTEGNYHVTPARSGEPWTMTTLGHKKLTEMRLGGGI